MCGKCLILIDGDDGVDFVPLRPGAGMGAYPKAKARYGHFHYEKIRFGGIDAVTGWKRRPSYRKDERIEFDPEKDDYTQRELEQLADQFLRDDARTIGRCECACDECKVGQHCSLAVCSETGKEKGIGGDNPILFQEHLYQRQKREILNENGVPEPGLVQGMYYRAHPEGRKINSEEQRKKHGASYYR